MVFFRGVKDWVKIGGSAAAIALASYFPSISNAAGPSKPKPMPTKVLPIAYEFNGEEAKNSAKDMKIRYADVIDHAALHGNDVTSVVYVTYDKQGTPVAAVRTAKGSVPEYFITPSPMPSPTRPAPGKPAAPAGGQAAKKPTLKAEKITDQQQITSILMDAKASADVMLNVAYIGIVDNGPKGRDASDLIVAFDANNKELFRGNYVVAPSPTGTPSPSLPPPPASPTPQPGYKWLGDVPIILSGRANVGYNRETVSGTLLDGMGTQWKDIYSALVLRLRDAGLTTDETRKLLHGRFLIDGNYLLLGKTSGTASGSFSRLETLVRILGGASGVFKDSDLRWSVDAGPAAEWDSSNYKFAGGSFKVSKVGAGAEIAGRLSSKTMSVGARDVYVSLHSNQDGYRSRDGKNIFAVMLDISSLGPVALHSEFGMESTSSDARSGQGDWNQHVPYGRVEATRAVGPVNVGGFVQAGMVAKSPVPADKLDSTTLQAGVAVNYQFSMPKK